MKTFTAVVILWADLIAALPLAVVLFEVISRLAPRSQFPVVLGSASIVLGVLACAVAGISFTVQGMNVIAVALAYFSFCYLAVSAGKIGNKLSRFLVTALATITIGIGYVLGTVGFLALMFMVGDYTNPPLRTLHVADNLHCEETGWGMAASDSGYTVHLYKQWPMLPFLEKELSQSVVNETNLKEGDKVATCESVAAEHSGQKPR